jgi:3-dehydroquinate synthase
VGLDEKESGLREILNFGHTFGHAIESGLGFGQWLHGQAVAAGMVMASELSVLMGGVDAQFVARLKQLLQHAQLPVAGADLAPETYLELMAMDKKSLAGDIRFVLLSAVGKAHVSTAPREKVLAVLAQNTRADALQETHAR